LAGELDAGVGAGARERMPARVLAERKRHRQSELLGIHDLVRLGVLEHPVLVDAGLVRERVRAHDRLVSLDGVARPRGDELRDAPDPADVDAGLAAERVPAYAERHHDLLERSVAGALADAVDGALDLICADRDA